MFNIYVGNLPFNASEEEVRSAFEEFGAVISVKLITDRETGRPRGFAFVEMENADEGNSAIQALDGQPMGGRPMRINEAKPREARPPRSSFSRY